MPIWALGTSEPVSVLLIDDDEEEASLTRALLKRVEDVRYELDWISTFDEGLAAVLRNDHDVYLVDHQLGGRTGVELVAEAREAGSLAGLIMLTGQRHRSTDIAAMNAGATDFLMKGKTDAALLDRTIRYAVSQAAVLNALHHSRNQLVGLQELEKILVEYGPTPPTVERVVELIVEHFGLPRVAIYLADGASLHLAAQRGYKNAAPVVSRADISVDRVAKAGKPVFRPSLSPEVGAGVVAVATELSVPLLVGGELAGLLNVASSAAAPIGESDYLAVRLIGDRLTVALETVYEQQLAAERLRQARLQLASVRTLRDAATQCYQRAMLEPLLDVALETSAHGGGSLGVLLIACESPESASISRLAELVRSVCGSRAAIRFTETQIAVLIVGAGHDVGRGEADSVLQLATADGLQVSCCYAALGPGGTTTELIGQAEAGLAYARRAGTGTLIS
jgi:FixJ family two-component response regulator